MNLADAFTLLRCSIISIYWITHEHSIIYVLNLNTKNNESIFWLIHLKYSTISLHNIISHGRLKKLYLYRVCCVPFGNHSSKARQYLHRKKNHLNRSHILCEKNNIHNLKHILNIRKLLWFIYFQPDSIFIYFLTGIIVQIDYGLMMT